jgi:radical SAM enzyme (TIGR01210 family)
MFENMEDLQLKAKEITRFLRKAFFDKEPVLSETPEEPFYFHVYTAGGQVPIFVLDTVPCDRFARGFCTPCAFSQYPLINSSDHYSNLEKQVDYIIDHANELMIDRQPDMDAMFSLPKKFEAPMYVLQLGGTSSFFRDQEIPSNYRQMILRKLSEFADDREVNLQVILETRAEHVLDSAYSGELESLASEFQHLNLTNLFGFESRDEWVRNVLYDKDLNIADFEAAIEVSKKNGIHTYAFVFAGLHSMNSQEIISDVDASVEYLHSRDVIPIVMLANIQPYTIPHILYSEDRYNLLDCKTLISIMDNLIKRDKPAQGFEHNWFIGGLQADPKPLHTLFDDPESGSCQSCIDQTTSALLELKQTYDSEMFERSTRSVKECSCSVSVDCNGTLEQRFSEDLEFADVIKEKYVERQNAIK